MSISQGLDISKREMRVDSEHHIDQSAYSLTSICSPTQTIRQMQFCKRKKIVFSIKYHVLYFAGTNFETSCIPL